ncbi:hypothetical protein BGZ98_006996 [Dissophora globulifera]|uniref:Uncharacterized protein n=1 Tax=Dissophora globulifera TaxID=979702 RepID=A0A9P6QZD7_9FUNG|nr:hypothetical protein BGZ98_006996 [Dissophora globulifera]KAG0308951.1 hypothetical protein BGZ99_001017 [Dissophora globulifera]
MGSYPKAIAVGFGIVGAAYALMVTTRLSPELKKEYEIVKADQARRQAFSDVLKRAAADPDPMWIKKETPKNP